MTDSYDPTAQVPDGIVLTRETWTAIMDAWAAKGGEPLTDDEVEAITGSAQPAPSIARSFPTGKHPNEQRNPFS